MFNIIETLWNYFTRKLRLYNLSSEAALRRKLVTAVFGGKLFGGSVFASHCCPCGAVSGPQIVMHYNSIVIFGIIILIIF